MTVDYSDTERRPYKLSFFGILRSEWIKLFSLRSTWWIMVVAVILNVGICAALAAAMSWTENQILTNPDFEQLPSAREPGVLQTGDLGMLSNIVAQGCGFMGQLVFVILSILLITNEYSSGMIRSTFTTAPRRGKVLMAKMLVIMVLCVLVFGASLAAGWSVSFAILRDSVGVDLTLTSSVSIRILGGFVAAMVLIALFSFGLGAIIRSTPGSIGTAFGIILVLPLVIGAITGTFSSARTELTGWRKWLTDLASFLPTNAGSVVTEVKPSDTAILGPWQGLAVLGGWALLSLIIAFMTTWRRDV